MSLDDSSVASECEETQETAVAGHAWDTVEVEHGICENLPTDSQHGDASRESVAATCVPAAADIKQTLDSQVFICSDGEDHEEGGCAAVEVSTMPLGATSFEQEHAQVDSSLRQEHADAGACDAQHDVARVMSVGWEMTGHASVQEFETFDAGETKVEEVPAATRITDSAVEDAVKPLAGATAEETDAEVEERVAEPLGQAATEPDEETAGAPPENIAAHSHEPSAEEVARSAEETKAEGPGETSVAEAAVVATEEPTDGSPLAPLAAPEAAGAELEEWASGVLKAEFGGEAGKTAAKTETDVEPTFAARVVEHVQPTVEADAEAKAEVAQETPIAVGGKAALGASRERAEETELTALEAKTEDCVEDAVQKLAGTKAEELASKQAGMVDPSGAATSSLAPPSKADGAPDRLVEEGKGSGTAPHALRRSSSTFCLKNSAAPKARKGGGNRLNIEAAGFVQQSDFLLLAYSAHYHPKHNSTSCGEFTPKSRTTPKIRQATKPQTRTSESHPAPPKQPGVSTKASNSRPSTSRPAPTAPPRGGLHA